MAPRRILLRALVAWVVSGCGARTELVVPDGGPFAIGARPQCTVGCLQSSCDAAMQVADDFPGNGRCVVMLDATVRCFGAGARFAGTMPLSERPMAIDGLVGVAEVAGNATTGCAVHCDGHLTCWGDARMAGAGFDRGGPSTRYVGPQRVIGIDDATEVYGRTASFTFYARRSDGSWWGWGELTANRFGVPHPDCSMPDFPYLSEPARTEWPGGTRSISLGAGRECAVGPEGESWCSSPAVECDPDSRRLWTNPVAEVAVDWTRCARFADGSVWCSWAENGRCDLPERTEPARIDGIEHAVDIATSQCSVCALIDDGTVRCVGHLSPPYGDRSSPFQIPGLDHVRFLSEHASCVIREDLSLWCVSRDQGYQRVAF